MIKYLGSKRVLLPQITRIVGAIPRATSVLDLFSGTSRVGHALKAQGFRVLVATSGTEALQLVHACAPTAICLDIFLPDMLGWTILSHLKQYPETRHIPVQIVTVEEERQHGLARGPTAFGQQGHVVAINAVEQGGDLVAKAVLRQEGAVGAALEAVVPEYVVEPVRPDQARSAPAGDPPRYRVL